MRGIAKMALTSRVTQGQPSNNESTYKNYEPQNRRDSRGRYAPRNEYGGMGNNYPQDYDPQHREMPENDYRMGHDEGWVVKPIDRVPQIKEEDRRGGNQYRMNDGGGRMIGFENNEENKRATRMQMNDGHSTKEHMQMGGANSREHSEKLDQRTAVEWVNRMENSDGSRGEHFTMEQTERIRKNKDWDCEPLEFWVAMNAMWSDGVATAKKYGVDKLDYWADRAKEFIHDKDARPDKLARYYQYIVKHE